MQLKMAAPARISKLVILSAHFGLQPDRQQWIQCLNNESFDHFLKQWYEQSLFDSLRSREMIFQKMMERRRLQSKETALKLLQNQSLGPFSQFSSSTLFLCGSLDPKYVALYQTIPKCAPVKIIEGAGHALHLEAPEAVAAHIANF